MKDTYSIHSTDIEHLMGKLNFSLCENCQRVTKFTSACSEECAEAIIPF